MKTLNYNIPITSGYNDIPSSVPIRRSDIDYDKHIKLESISSDENMSAYGWEADSSIEERYGYVQNNGLKFVKNNYSSMMPMYLTRIENRRIEVDETNPNWEIVVFKRSKGQIYKYKKFINAKFGNYRYSLNKPESQIFNLEDDGTNQDGESKQVFRLFKEEDKLIATIDDFNFPYAMIEGMSRWTNAMVINVIGPEGNTHEMEKVSERVHLKNGMYVKTKFFPISRIYAYIDDNGTLEEIDILKRDDLNGIYLLPKLDYDVYLSYDVTPALAVVADNLVYRDEIIVDSDINLFELDSPDIEFLTINTENDSLQFDKSSSVSRVDISAPHFYDSIFVEPSDNIVINNDFVKAGEKYEISNSGKNTLSLSYSLTPLDMMSKVIKDGDNHKLNMYKQGTLASFYGKFTHNDMETIYHISFNKKGDHTDEYISGSLNLSNGGLYTVLATGSGLSIKVDTSISGSIIALPSLALLNDIAVYKHFGGTMSPTLEWDYTIPGIITLKEDGVYTIEYKPFIDSNFTTVRIQNDTIQKSFIEKLEEFGDALKEIYCVYSKRIKLKLGYYINNSPNYLGDEYDIYINVDITPDALKAMVTETKNIIL